MAIDFAQIFKDAVKAGVEAAKPGGKMAEDWIKKSAAANEDALLSIADSLAAGRISTSTARFQFQENEFALKSEASALKVIVKASAQAAVNGFFGSLRSALLSALKVAL